MRLVALAVAVSVVVTASTLLRAHERITTTVTWDREVSAIVKARCLTCHREGGSAPMSFATWAQARPWARAIRHEVMARRMPIWHAARGYGDFANDPSLSPFEIALVVAWVDGGAPRSFVPKGSPATRLPGPPEVPLVAEPGGEWARPNARQITLPCGDHAAPRGRLLGLRPELREHGSARVLATLADGRKESLGWFIDFDPKSPTTYWLRAPLDFGPGARIRIAPVASASWLLETAVAPSTCRAVLFFDSASAR